VEIDAQHLIVATYDYHDQNGALLMQVVRKLPKTFLQRRRGAHGEWIWNVKGIELVPYRLHELIAADPHDRIFIVEGEKDADNLAACELTATTNPGGAGKWRASMSQYMRGRRVVILPDNDEAGEKHAADVAKKLKGIAAEIRILRLPNLPPKGDVSNWMSAGGTGDELERLAAKAPLWDAATKPATAEIDVASLVDFLCVRAWANRDLPPTTKLLGELLTTTARVFFVGQTGLGKTNLAMAMAIGAATGDGFLHWRCERPVRVAIIDGEMASELIKSRSIDVLRRSQVTIPPGMLTIYARDYDEQIAKAFPGLGTIPPLNTTAGHEWVYKFADIVKPEVIFFDNVMSLLVGDMKEEQPWNDTLPLINGLSARRIGQVWLDHTGHEKTRQYGSSTKAWRFDAVGIMTPLPDADRVPDELAFQLSFEPPGKARRRTPDNRADFETCIIRLANDEWSCSRTAGGKAIKPKVSAAAAALHKALLDALVRSDPPGSTTRADWYAEGVRLGLLDPIAVDDGRKERERKAAKLRKYIGELKAAGWIGVDGETVRDLQLGARN
jgi:hypothetical protein